MKKIGLLTQGLFGGTDRLINDFAKWLNGNGYKSILLNEKQECEIRDIEFIILPTSELSWLWANRKKINKTCRVMVWCFGHDALQAFFYNESNQSKSYRFLFSKLYIFFGSRLVPTHCLKYTDLIGENLDLNNLHQPLITKSTNIYPIPIQVPALVTNSSIENKENLLQSFFWVGRIDRDFKVWCLIELLNEVNTWSKDNNKTIKFNIIGDGDGIECIKVEDYLFEINFLGALNYKEMEYVIRSKANLLFAMGTSALEGGRQLVPTVIVNPLREFEKQVSYRWIFNSIGYSLGEFQGAFVYPKQPKKSLDRILEEFQKDPSFMSASSYDYAKKFNREVIYRNIMNSREDLPTFSTLKNILFIPYFSFHLKKTIKLFIWKIK